MGISSPSITPPERDQKSRRLIPLLTAAAVIITAASINYVKHNGGSGAAPAAGAASVATVSISADTTNTPPKTLIAAGRVAMSAYWVGAMEEISTSSEGTVKRLNRTWYLYNPATATYEKTPYSWVAVSPGMRQAAVLHGSLPSNRLGILDMTNWQVIRWIDLPQRAGSVEYSPNGDTILTTTYTAHPDEVTHISRNVITHKGPVPRNGFQLTNADTGETKFVAVASAIGRAAGLNRNDFAFTRDGNLVALDMREPKGRAYYASNGRKISPPRSAAAEQDGDRLSPDGRLLAGPPGLPTKVTDAATGKAVGTQQALNLLAWADNENLVAWVCKAECENEFNNALALVSVDGKKVIQLSSFRENGDSPETWHPIFTTR